MILNKQFMDTGVGLFTVRRREADPPPIAGAVLALHESEEPDIEEAETELAKVATQVVPIDSDEGPLFAGYLYEGGDLTEPVFKCEGTSVEATQQGLDEEIASRYGESVEVSKRFAQANEFISKAESDDEDYMFVFGAVLVPESVDKQGDIIGADVIEKAAHDFMESSRANDLLHQDDLSLRQSVVVESSIVRSRNGVTINGVKYAKGTWLAGTRVYDEKIQKMIREGKVQGYSIVGKGRAAAD